LVYDLRFRFRGRKCNSRDSFEVTVEELGTGPDLKVDDLA